MPLQRLGLKNTAIAAEISALERTPSYKQAKIFSRKDQKPLYFSNDSGAPSGLILSRSLH